MPKATATALDTERFDLKSCPGGFVVLRRLNYGEYLKRREMTSGMKIKADQRRKDFEGELSMAQRKVTEFEFAACIVDHNLEDDNGDKLDFSNVKSLDLLASRIGDEIGTYIDKLNQFNELEGDEGNSQN